MLASAVVLLVVVAALLAPTFVARPAQAADSAPLALFPATTTLAGQVSGRLPRDKLTLTSALAVDLTDDLVVLPLHHGTYHGQSVWYVITDVSDMGIARTLGLNFAPRLANIDRGCASCLQTVASTSPVLGRGVATFAGVPDFSAARVLVPGQQGIPLLRSQPGAVADASYSPFVRIRGTRAVYDAPIVAVGSGEFDVVHHSDTHDRVLAIDTRAMTVSLLLAHGFANGQPIVYLSMDASDPLTATFDRATFVPALGAAPYPNGSIPLTADLEQNEYVPGVTLSPPPPPRYADDEVNSARAELFSFANGSLSGAGQPGQGEANLILDGHAAQEATLDNQALLTALRLGGDLHDVFSFFPTLREARYAQDYSPVGDLNVGVWSKVAIAHHLNTPRTDAIEIEELAQDHLITAPGGFQLASSGAVVNCPAVGYTGDAPSVP